MNYSMAQNIEYFISAFACCFGMFYTGKILLQVKAKDIKIGKYLLLIIFSIIIVINSLTFDNVAKIFGSMFVLFLIYKLIFSEKNINCFLLTIFTYFAFILGEITFVFITSLIDYIFNLDITETIVKSIYANAIISFLSCIYTYLFRNLILKYVEKMSKSNIIFLFTLGIVTVLVVISSIYNLYLNEWQVDYAFFLNTIIIIGCVVLTLVLFKQHLKNKEITDKYSLLEEYMKTSAELIEKYSSTVHKYKNNLIAIKGYVKSNDKEVLNYIDNLLDNYKTKKYSWFSKINYIKIDTIRYLIYYKLSKAEDSNLKISVYVEDEIKKINANLLTIHETNTLLEILGEYFDNAIYASSESRKKELNFMLCIEDNSLVFLIANTFKEKVDLSLITKNGYTTKGKGHGLGLYDIEKSIREVSSLDCNYDITDEYFVTKLILDKKNKI